MKKMKKCLLILSSLSLLASCSSSSATLIFEEMDNVAKENFTAEKALATYEGSGHYSCKASYPQVTEDSLKVLCLGYLGLESLPTDVDSATILTPLGLYTASDLEADYQSYVQGKDGDDTYLKNSDGTYSLQFTYSGTTTSNNVEYGIAIDVQKKVNEVGLLLSSDLVAAFSDSEEKNTLTYHEVKTYTWTKKA